MLRRSVPGSKRWVAAKGPHGLGQCGTCQIALAELPTDRPRTCCSNNHAGQQDQPGVKPGRRGRQEPRDGLGRS
eukprot:7561417-Alexandrium_andersonii.AAC.1